VFPTAVRLVAVRKTVMRSIQCPAGLTVMLRALRTTTVLAATFALASPAMADEVIEPYVQEAGAAERIDSAGKLRMLSQRVVAAACYAQAGIKTDETTASLSSAMLEFRQITGALAFGDPALGINGGEADANIRATLETLFLIWAPIEITGSNVIEGTATHEEIAEMASRSELLLDMAERLVSAVSAEHSVGAEIVIRDATAIDVAGRQRMLSQRISKNVCLLATGVETAQSRDELIAAAGTFETSLSALRAGMPSAGIMAPTDAAVIADLEIAVADWEIVQTQIADAVAGNEMDAQRLGIMFELSNVLTADMNKVVIDYTLASK